MSQPTDYAVVAAMSLYGGGFVQALAALLNRADPQNIAKIKATWPEIWAEYVDLAKSRHERGMGPA